MNLDFESVKEAKSNYPTRLDPSIHDVEIAGIKDVKPEEPTRSPYMEWSFVNDNGEHKERFYMSEAAGPISLSKMKHLCMQMITEKELNKVSNTSDLERLLTGQKVRIKLSGEEISGEKSNFIKAKFSWPPFAENIKVDKEKSTLKFNERTDVKLLESVTEATTSSNSTGSDDDLPF